MKQYIKLLGKVCATVDGDWDNTREYERLCIVRDVSTMKTYISKMFVPADVDILDEKYWQYLCNGAIINNLTSTDAEAALSANMGRVLASMIQDLTDKEADDVRDLYQAIHEVDIKHEEDVDRLTNMVENIATLEIRIVSSLPPVGESGYIYFVNSGAESGYENIFTEYVWVGVENSSSGTGYEILGQYKADPDKVTFRAEFTSGVKIGTLTINGTAHDIYIPVWNGTLAQYNAISVKDSRFIYNIIE